MQDTKEKFSSLNASSINELVSQNPTMNSRRLFDPYLQQRHDINHMLQSQMTMELCSQLKLLEERASSGIKAEDNFIDEATVKNREMEMRLKKAIAEAEFWKKSSHEKTVLCNDLASRLLILKKREMRKKRVSERVFAEEAESSSGDNGDDDVDTACTLMCKRRRL